MDWFSNKFYDPETLFIQIVDKFNGTNDEVNNLKNKRVRVTEYLIHRILIELYNQYLSLPLLKSAEKNIDLVNVWNSDSIKSNIQLSNKINPIASISEMDRLTYLGMGGFDSKHNLIELRDIHPSYYKNIDPIMTPDREKSGVVMNSCLLAKFDEDGKFLYIRGDE
jgi:DNA-directed RNA polymerase beta subunit